MNIFFISDLHLGHNNVIKFTYEDGTRLRPFDSIEEHDAHVVDEINKVVRPHDRLIIVGDCVVNKNHMSRLDWINGKKTLVMGNHDPVDPEFITPYFEKIAGALSIDQFIVTHIPVHPNQLEYRFKGNIHGHLHGLSVKTPRYVPEESMYMEQIDERYYNVSIESLNYTPVSLEDIKSHYRYVLP